MALMYSIHSKHVRNILDGKKKAELRKSIPPHLKKLFDNAPKRIKLGRSWLNPIPPKYYAFIYCTKDDPYFTYSGKVACEVEITGYDVITKDTPIDKLNKYSVELFLPVEDILEYIGKRKKVYVVHFGKLTKFKKPKELSDFTHCTQPHAYCPMCNLGGETHAEWVETREDLSIPGATSWYCANWIKRPPQSYYDNVRLGGDV